VEIVQLLLSNSFRTFFYRPPANMIVCVGRTGFLLLVKEEERKEVVVLNPVAWQSSLSLLQNALLLLFLMSVPRLDFSR
jgi:hypothetical protein